MIGKIKELMKIKEIIDSFSGNIEKQKKQISALSSEIKDTKKGFQELKNEIKEMKASQENIARELEKSLGSIKNSAESLDTEIKDFKLLKGQITSKIIESVKEEIQNSFLDSMERLKTDVKRFNDLRDELLKMKSKLDSLSGEINKFQEISRKIKKEDFELTKYAKMITAQDNEKLRLMKQIDTLQRLISRERRKRY